MNETCHCLASRGKIKGIEKNKTSRHKAVKCFDKKIKASQQLSCGLITERKEMMPLCSVDPS